MYVRHRQKKRLMGDINVVPYIDVMLVLLVIFMVTAPLLTEGVKIEMVQAQSKPIDSEDQEPFVVSVTKDGKYYLNEETQQSVSAEDIRIKAAAVLRHRPKTQFLVRGDRDVAYGVVVQAMVNLQQAGVPNVGLVTTPPDTAQPNQ